MTNTELKKKFDEVHTQLIALGLLGISYKNAFAALSKTLDMIARAEQTAKKK